MSKTLTFARTNLARAAELRDELRQLDVAASTNNRDFTSAEKATIESHRSEISACEARAQAILEQEDRGAQLGAGSLSGALHDIGVDTRSDGGRVLGAMPPIQFSDEQLRGLHDDYRSNRAASATVDGAMELRDVTAVPMSLLPTYNLQPITKLRERTRLANLMPTQRVETASATYYTTSTGATAAATVAEGGTKPESTPAWTAVSAPIRKIAHFVDVSKEALDDYSNFVQVVRDEMTAGLYNAENLQLISGNGTPPNLTGLLDTSGILTYLAPSGSEETAVSIRKAITLMQNAFVEPEVVILNPADAELFDLTNFADDGLHAVMTVAEDGAKSAWGLKIIVTTQIASGTALVANLTESTVVFLREPATIFVDPYSQSDKNMVRFICEERIGLGVTRPTGICEVTFDYVP